MIYKFVDWEINPLESFADTTMYKLHEKLENDEKPTREEKNMLVFPRSEPVYKRGGWAYNFLEFLNEYFVEDRYGHIETVWAWDKTAIRKSEKFGPIRRIVAVNGEEEDDDE